MPALDFDDAFTDDDDEQAPEFSPDAIRQHIQQSMAAAVQDDQADFDPNASISTFDINGSQPRDSDSRSPSPESKASDLDPSEFSTVSLPLEGQPNSFLSNPASPERLDKDFNEDHSDKEHSLPTLVISEDTVEDESHDYPNVVINLEAEPDHRVSDHSFHAPQQQLTSQPTSPSNDLPPLRLEPRSPTNSHHQTQSTSDVSTTIVPPQSPARLSSANEASPSSSTFSQQQAESQKKMGHRPTRSVGPSTFEKVRSRTRPVHLPPKNRAEDNKHLADWEEMMKLSRLAVEKRRADLQRRRLEREKRIEESLHLWERDIVPDWRVVHSNPALRKLWWQGIPTKLRGSMWEKAVGNALALSKESYRTSLTRAKRALAAGTFPSASLSLLDEDVATTLPALHIFNAETGPLYSDLKDILYAWIVARSDEGLGYTFGIARLAAMLLITMPPPQAFVVMRNLLERHCLRSFYGGSASREDVEAYYRIFDTLLADGMPKIYFNFKQHQISPASYFPDWIMPLFLDHLPFEACARIWDVIMLEGDSFVYRAALGILAVLEPRLFFPDKRELLELLKGENKAAIEVATREGVPLNGGKYEIYGVDEENLWDRIESMNDWWKDSTWKRLLTRELPDV